MKLRKQAGDSWQYELSEPEALCLRGLLKQFPFAAGTALPISRTESNPKTLERQRLLNESLAEHRNGLKRKAAAFLTADKLKAASEGWRLQISSEEREFLLQLLNDIRIESWHALGKPESLETEPPPTSKTKLSLHHLMQLAGFFESELLSSENLMPDKLASSEDVP